MQIVALEQEWFEIIILPLLSTNWNIMKKILLISAVNLLLLLACVKTKGQPIPIELMMGNNSGAVNLAFSRDFSQTSRLGFFHQNTIEFDYNEPEKNSFFLQDLLYVETFKNLRVAGGVAYSKGGFAPTAGLQYVYASRKLLFLCAPRVNIVEDPSYDIMSILQYKQEINEKLKLYTRIQLLNVFDSAGNIRSYQWLRLGLETKGIQFGLAVNLDEYGPSPSVEGNYGLFIRKEIF